MNLAWLQRTELFEHRWIASAACSYVDFAGLYRSVVIHSFIQVIYVEVEALHLVEGW
jgi:hypothetical protein